MCSGTTVHTTAEVKTILANPEKMGKIRFSVDFHVKSRNIEVPGQIHLKLLCVTKSKFGSLKGKDPSGAYMKKEIHYGK